MGGYQTSYRVAINAHEVNNVGTGFSSYFSLLVASKVSSNVTVQVGVRLDVAYFRMYVCFNFRFPEPSELIPL